jgi:hypothetical protein
MHSFLLYLIDYWVIRKFPENYKIIHLFDS